MEYYNVDTPIDVVREQKDIRIKGLYFMYHGEKTTPRRIYFGIEFPPNGCIGGMAYCHFDNVLYPVMTSKGEQYRVSHLRDVIANYDGHTISSFRCG